jgi:hypothetical protein
VSAEEIAGIIAVVGMCVCTVMGVAAFLYILYIVVKEI